MAVNLAVSKDMMLAFLRVDSLAVGLAAWKDTKMVAPMAVELVD